MAISKDITNTSWVAIKQEPNPDNKAELFQYTIDKIVNNHSPIKSVRVPSGKQPISSPLINKLKRAKKRAHSKCDPKWKQLGKRLEKELKRLQKTQANSKVNQTVSGTRSWWNSVRSITGDMKHKPSSEFVFIDEQWLNKQQFCSQLNSYYLEKDSNVSLEMPQLPDTEYNLPDIPEWEVYPLLKAIDTNKSTHSADYPSWVTKNNAKILAEPISDIINTIMRTGIYPNLWKRAEITPLPKLTNPKMFKDYRPISLLYHLSKITEKCINKELAKYIPPDCNQYAYTKTMGTTDALVKTTTEIAYALDSAENYGAQALYIDFSKAFDLMRPDILSMKLINLSVHPSIIKLVRSFLTDRQQCVKFQGYKSENLPTHVGVSQGTISGPQLWNIYVSDLNPAENTVKYADDTTCSQTLPRDR